jgi:hypothetical protein
MMPVSFRRGRAVVFALLAATSVLLTSVSVSYAEMPHNRRCDIAQGIRLRAADPFQLAFQIVGIVGNDRRRFSIAAGHLGAHPCTLALECLRAPPIFAQDRANASQGKR